MRQTVLILDDGSVTHQLIKVPNDQLKKWDTEHDEAGHSVKGGDSEGDDEKRD